MDRLKVMTVVGTRPEIIRLSAVIRRLDSSDAVAHVLVHTGQNYDYELSQVFFEDFGIRKPDYFLSAAGGSAAETIGKVLTAIEPVLQREHPDAFLVLGDTNSCLGAIAAKKRHIPIFHMEAGNRCFDQRVPEETNRKIVDHIADINMTYSSIAREYLLREGLPADRVIKTGSPMFEVIESKRGAIEKSDVLDRLGLKPGEYYVVSAHREENVDDPARLGQLAQSLGAVAKQSGLPVVFSTHPRTQKRLDALGIALDPQIRQIKPLGFCDYIRLQQDAKAVLSDSGTISEEASILSLRALNIREAHERPAAMEEAAVMMTGLGTARILQGLAVLETQQPGDLLPVRDYRVPNVSEKVLRILLSYTDYVNRTVWGK